MRYYNKSGGLLAIALGGGKTGMFASRVWTEVAAEDEGASQLQAAVRKGFLVRDPLASLVTETATGTTEEAAG